MGCVHVMQHQAWIRRRLQTNTAEVSMALVHAPQMIAQRKGSIEFLCTVFAVDLSQAPRVTAHVVEYMVAKGLFCQ